MVNLVFMGAEADLRTAVLDEQLPAARLSVFERGGRKM